MNELQIYNPELTKDLQVQIAEAYSQPKAYKKLKEAPANFVRNMSELIKNAYVLAGVTMPDDYDLPLVIAQINEIILKFKNLTVKDIEIIFNEGALGNLDGIHFKRLSAKLFQQWAETYGQSLKKKVYEDQLVKANKKIREDEPLPRQYSTAEHLHNFETWAKECIKQGKPVIDAKYKAHSLKWFDLLNEQGAFKAHFGEVERNQWKDYYSQKVKEEEAAEKFLVKIVDKKKIKRIALKATKRHFLYKYVLKKHQNEVLLGD